MTKGKAGWKKSSVQGLGPEEFGDQQEWVHRETKGNS